MAALIRRGLAEDGFAADVATRGEEALVMAGSSSYDAIVLDVMLPGIDGFETCRALREDGVWVPVLMLTARGAVEDRVAGLDRRRRRLSDQALLLRRAAGPSARADPSWAGRAPLRPRGGRPSPRPGQPPSLARRGRDCALGQGIRPARGIHASSRPCPHAAAVAGAGLGVRLRAPLERDRGLCPLPATEDRQAIRPEVDRDRPGSGYRLRKDGGC